jgi:soluble lytic murein transglycosylase-like protein
VAFAEAAAAVRDRDCAATSKAVAPLASGAGSEAELAKLLSGLYARVCGQTATAVDRLSRVSGGAFEDWRLFVLAEAARELGQAELAETSLARLLGDYPASPLRPRALVAAAQLAGERGNFGAALELVAQGRRESLAGKEAAALEALAWQIGTLRSDTAVRRQAARRLLADFPLTAGELKVVEVFRHPDGSLDWESFLSAEELKRRARSLLAAELLPSAGETLDAVGAGERDVEWLLLKAETLTRSQQGTQAIALLAGRSGRNGKEEAALEWARAQAAEEAGTARRGRKSTAAERREWKSLAQRFLARVAQIGEDRGLAIQALRELYTLYAGDELYDRGVETLRKLRQLDPLDSTGAANLWELGWNEYGKRNFTGAVGFWTELFDLYPETAPARRGRYWTARAFEALGESERAQQVFDQIAAADTNDFYRRNALARLSRKTAPATAAPPREEWPADRALERAVLLTNLGLDELAAHELELVRSTASARAVSALEAQILAHRGDRRKSVVSIRDAFPALGGAHQAALPEQALQLYYPVDYQEPIRSWAASNGLPAHLVFGMIRQESAFDTRAVSRSGARGLMQLMPATAKELAKKLGVPFSHAKLTDPALNVQLGTTYFRQVLAMFDGNLELGLAGYNGGPYRIKRLWNEQGGEIDRFLEGLSIEESKVYVKRILVLSDSYRRLYPGWGGAPPPPPTPHRAPAGGSAPRGMV